MNPHLPISLISFVLFSATNIITPNPKVVDSGNSNVLCLQNTDSKIVLIPSVNYYYFDWEDWGLSNDYLQEKLISDLSANFSEKFLFYTEEELTELGIYPDLTITLEFTNITIGEPKILHEKYGKVNDLKTISSSSVPPSSISTSGTPSIIYTTKTIDNKASLQCKIYQRETESEIFSSPFPSTYKWEEQVTNISATGAYLQDKFAKPMPNKNELNAFSSQIISPLNKELGKKLMDICYKKALKKIENILKHFKQNNSDTKSSSLYSAHKNLQ